MKVLYIIHSCIMGGASISFYNLIKGIKQKGYEIIIVCPKLKKKDSKELIEAFKRLKCKYVYALVPSSWSFWKTKKSKIKLPVHIILLIIKKIIFYYQLKRIIKKERPNIIHTNSGVVHEGAWLANKFSIPHVWHLREYQLKDFNMHPFPALRSFKKILRKSYTVCITKDIQNYFGLANFANSKVIYNPVMPEEKCVNKKIISSTIPYFLIANRLSEEKGLEDIIFAFSEFIKNHLNYKLKICGFGPENYVKYLKKLCQENMCSDSIEFLGYSRTDFVYSLMNQSAALIVGSYNEGFGRMTAEANMLGIPVIGRNTGGTKEILEQTQGGILFKTRDELIKSLIIISNMTNTQRISFMEKPKEIAKNLFSSEQHVNKIDTLYRKISCVGGGRTRLIFHSLLASYKERIYA